MRKILRGITAVFLCVIIGLLSQGTAYRSKSTFVRYGSKTESMSDSLISSKESVEISDGDVMIDVTDLDETNYFNQLIFPFFNDNVTLTRGTPNASQEDYTDYKELTSSRYEFADMVGHASEVSAVRLAQKGIFEKTENFNPQGSMTELEFCRALIKLCGKTNAASASSEEVCELIQKSNLLSSGVFLEPEKTLTREKLAYYLGRATSKISGSEQYSLLLDDYKQINSYLRSAVLNSIAAGITEITDFKIEPEKAATRAEIADGLYRLYNARARVIPLYDIYGVYKAGVQEYITKTTYTTNDSGTRFGFFTNYSKQQDAFLNYGMLPIDRTGFYKWNLIETSQGVYEMPNFNNDKSSHKVGETIINCIDICANLNWNSLLDKSNIPSFYTQDITDSTTRNAAKSFLYAFVQEMLSAVEGDVILCIDYELDSRLAIWNNAEGRARARAFTDWFKEACAVARHAAEDMGKGKNLDLIVIYNNITPTHLLGPEINQWMLEIAQAVDYIGIDTYNFYDDKTDPSYTLQNIRFLINNYSLGKPVIVVENGLGMLRDLNTVDEVTGLNQLQMSETYYRNLFREFCFALEKGDFLNANLFGFLFWSYYDTSTTSEKIYGIVNENNALRSNGTAIKEGISRLYSQRQFNPSKRKSKQAFQKNMTFKVTSGTEYDEVTILKNISGSDKTAAVSLETNINTCAYVTVNGNNYFTDHSLSKYHSVEISDLKEGINVITVRFGCEKMPCEIQVKSVEVFENQQSSLSIMGVIPEGSLLSGKTPVSIVTGRGNLQPSTTATGGSPLTMWTNGSIKENLNGLYMQGAKGMMIAYDMDSPVRITSVLLSSGNLSKPSQARWKVYASDNSNKLFYEENCIAYVNDKTDSGTVTQLVAASRSVTARYIGFKLLNSSNISDTNAYISEIAVFSLEGDVNLDSVFDIRDMVHLKKCLAGMLINTKNASLSDQNRDGALNGLDIAKMNRVLLKREGYNYEYSQ